MIWFERMNRAVDYIEKNLCAEMDFGVIGKIACQSPVSFQRTFSIVTDISVFEYIRRRRMTLAAFDLQNGNEKVIDVSLRYGYESPEAFTRAFKDVHGASPSNARKYGLPLKAFPRITFLPTIKGDAVMEYRIEKRQGFTVYGIEGVFSTDDGKHERDIPTFWEEIMLDGRFNKLIHSTNEVLSRIHAVCDYRDTGGNSFPYMIFTHETKNCDTKGFTRLEVPAATWAVFKSDVYPILEETAGAVQGLMKKVYTDWLPTAAYEKVDGYELELYLASGVDQYYIETWIRVVPK